MSSPQNDFSASPANKLPPLLGLPLEIKQDILACFHDSLEPTLAILRRTHSSFYCIIPKSEVRPKAPRQLRSQLLEVEAAYPYLLPPGHYTCFECLCVLHRDSFSDNQTRKSKGLGNVKAYQRYCLCCGVINGKYRRGTTVPVGGITRTSCYSCGHFILDVPFEEPLVTNCRAHLEHLAKVERDIFQAKIDWLKAGAEEEKIPGLGDWWSRSWCRRGRIAWNDEKDVDDWLPDKTIPAPGEPEGLSILAYLKLR